MKCVQNIYFSHFSFTLLLLYFYFTFLVSVETDMSVFMALCVSQEKRISSLDAANSRLMSALTQVKERYSMHSLRNGLSPTNPTKLSITENGEFKNSSCWLDHSLMLNNASQYLNIGSLAPVRFWTKVKCLCSMTTK